MVKRRTAVYSARLAPEAFVNKKRPRGKDYWHHDLMSSTLGEALLPCKKIVQAPTTLLAQLRERLAHVVKLQPRHRLPLIHRTDGSADVRPEVTRHLVGLEDIVAAPRLAEDTAREQISYESKPVMRLRSTRDTS